jgi:thymidylate synthase
MIQFHVSEGRLSCMASQRSADILLGVPVNIASYALLTTLVAREVGLEVGDLVYNFGDIHLYANHVEQAIEQCNRRPLPSPTLLIHDRGQSIVDTSKGYGRGDFKIIDYHPHPAIKAPVSV